jgi:FkbM family methyltransferase
MNKLEAIRNSYLSGKLTRLEASKRFHRAHQNLYQYKEILKKSNASSITITANEVILTTQGGIKFVIDEQDCRSNPIESLNFGSLEGADEELFLNILRKCDFLVDVGANIGWYALHAAMLNQKVKSIYCFEPLSLNREFLERNIASNKQAEKICVFHYALGSAQEEKELYWTPAEKGATSFYNVRELTNPNYEAVEVRRLDDMNLKLGELSVIKIDTEGSEYFVLDGAQATVRKYRPIVFCEILRKWSRKAGVDYNSAIRLMTSFNYEVYVSDAKSRTLRRIAYIDDDTTNTNFFFIPTEKIISLGSICRIS